MRMSFSPSPSGCLSSPECDVPGWERPGPKRGDSNNLAKSRDQSVSPQSSPSLQGSSKPGSSKSSVSEQFKYSSTQGFFRWRWRLLHHGALVLPTAACPPLSHSSLWMHLSLISEEIPHGPQAHGFLESFTLLVQPVQSDISNRCFHPTRDQ